MSIAQDVGRTALHYAAKRGDREVLEILIKAGCNPTKKTGLGLTAMDEAAHAVGIDFSCKCIYITCSLSLQIKTQRPFRILPDVWAGALCFSPKAT